MCRRVSLTEQRVPLTGQFNETTSRRTIIRVYVITDRLVGNTLHLELKYELLRVKKFFEKYVNYGS